MIKSRKTQDALSSDIYKRLLGYVWGYWPRLSAGILCGLLYGGATFGMLVALRWALGGISGESLSLDGGFPSIGQPEGTAGGMGLKRLLLTVSILPVVTILQGVLFFAGRYFVVWVGFRVVMDLRNQLFRHIHALPMQFFTGSRTGDLISRITSDTMLLAQLVSNVISDLIREPFTLIGCIAAMIYLDWKLSLVAIVIFPVCILPIVLLGRRIRKASKGGQERTADMLSVVQESIGGAVVVKAFQTEDEEADRFKVINLQVFKMFMRQARANALIDPVVVFLSSIGLSAVVIYAYMSDLSLALLITFAGALIQMYKPAKKLSQIYAHLQNATPGAERVFEILDTENTVTDRPGSQPFTGSVETVEFQNAGFAYESGKKALERICLSTRAGQCIAFVGSSGAGKTTLVNLIPRFFDATEGAVLLNGKDVRDYTLHSLRAQIGVVTQQTILFNRSVAENIAYGTVNATREKIEDAARRANAHDFIVELENGYDTVIGERGSRLSGGMAQRLAIARALLKNPPILILDEATSALDTESERLVQGALDELMKDRTVFVIAHRLSTIQHADQIVVLDQGKIVEQGTHAGLLAHGGSYKYFYDIQFSKIGDLS